MPVDVDGKRHKRERRARWTSPSNEYGGTRGTGDDDRTRDDYSWNWTTSRQEDSFCDDTYDPSP
ncbi:hypothetical protein P3T76_015554 [Phytophthora citrophthora]|uniref:Uncharacterized protein n=1 Tax=Phytophthora citrophthora TaxID=4793 RepID=A0AAD9LB82_9STRA|nr:hypothetical protein P3T76_015554 [Phytophthora citrophthora]